MTDIEINGIKLRKHDKTTNRDEGLVTDDVHRVVAIGKKRRAIVGEYRIKVLRNVGEDIKNVVFDGGFGTTWLKEVVLVEVKQSAKSQNPKAKKRTPIEASILNGTRYDEYEHARQESKGVHRAKNIDGQ